MVTAVHRPDIAATPMIWIPRSVKPAAVKQSYTHESGWRRRSRRRRMPRANAGAVVSGKQAYRQGAPYAVHHNAPQPRPPDRPHAAYGPAARRRKPPARRRLAPITMAPRAVRHITSGGDGHQAGQRGIQAHRNIGLAVLDPGNDHAHDRGHRGRDRGGEEDRSQARAPEVAAAPLKPYQPSHRINTPSAADGQVVSGERVDA